MRLRVLHLTATLDPLAGGTSTIVKELSSALGEVGCAVTVVCLDEYDRQWHSINGVTVIPLGWPIFRHRYSFALRLRRWVRAAAGQFDVVVVHGIWQFPLLVALEELPRARTPFVVYAHGMLTTGAMRWGIIKYWKKRAYWLVAARRALERAEKVICTTQQEFEKSPVLHQNTGIQGVVIRNGIAGVPSRNSGLTQSTRSAPYLLALGRIHPIKGLDIAIRAIANNDSSRCRLIIAGDGDPVFVRDMKRLVGELGIVDRVEFVGLVAGTLKDELIRKADALLAPSHHENFGISIVEALSAGVPVLTTREVGVWREVEMHSAGMLFNTTVDDCSAAIRMWTQLTSAEKEGYRRRARECFEINFMIERTAAELRDLLASVVSRSIGRG